MGSSSQELVVLLVLIVLALPLLSDGGSGSAAPRDRLRGVG